MRIDSSVAGALFPSSFSPILVLLDRPSRMAPSILTPDPSHYGAPYLTFWTHLFYNTKLEESFFLLLKNLFVS